MQLFITFTWHTCYIGVHQNQNGELQRTALATSELKTVI